MRETDLSVTHRTANVNGIRMHYVEKGSGPLVVLLHGFPENWWSWRYQIEPLVAAGFRVIAPDQRGYNDTEARGPYDIDTLAEDVHALIRHAGERDAIVVAHDWGGAVAWHFATFHPDALRRLVVMNCPHPVLLREALLHNPTQIRRSWYMFFFQLPRAPEWFLTRGGASQLRAIFRSHSVDRTHFGNEEIEPFRAGVLKPGRATGMVNWYRSAIRTGLRSTALAKRYRPFDAPTLLIWGMRDHSLGFDDVVPGTDRFARALTVRTIEECGHFVQQEQPEAVNASLVEFLHGDAETRG